MKRLSLILACALAMAAACCTRPSDQEGKPRAIVLSVKIDGVSVLESGTLNGVGLQPGIEVGFSREIVMDDISLASCISYSGGKLNASLDPDDASVMILTPAEKLIPSTAYRLGIVAGEGFGVNLTEGFTFSFRTAFDDSRNDFPQLTADELLTLVQQRTFGYFWDYAHPVSGLARERLGSGETVTSGGSGFGLMTIPMAIERGFITREEGCERAAKVVDFLQNKAQRFHGAFSHWLNGTTGNAIAFSSKDNGADLVETAFLMQGLLTLRAYFDKRDMAETKLRSAITALWEAVEWDHFTRGGQNVLYWHWSPDYGWQMNMHVRGWNEALIVYVLAAASPTHSVSRDVYDKGWAANMRNGRSFYDITLPLGPDYGGPMFFAHYSFLGLDPRKLKDAYADYWEQNCAHAKINYEYCVKNPKHKYGYSERCWGLTASDIKGGYTASSPTNDRGTIAPTAALASMPYTPEESMAALEYFYYHLGQRLWGEYGFYDAFSLEDGWFAPSYIAIDQGPIAVMIENYRSGLLWDTFMKDPDVCRGLDNLGFSY